MTKKFLFKRSNLIKGKARPFENESIISDTCVWIEKYIDRWVQNRQISINNNALSSEIQYFSPIGEEQKIKSIFKT